MARKGMKASHYRQVMGDQSPVEKLIRIADHDVQERIKADQEVKAINSKGQTFSWFLSSGRLVSKRG